MPTTISDFAELDVVAWSTVKWCELYLATNKSFVVMLTRTRDPYVLCTDCMTKVCKFRETNKKDEANRPRSESVP